MTRMKRVSTVLAFFCLFLLGACSAGPSNTSGGPTSGSLLSPSDMPGEANLTPDAMNNMPAVKIGLLLPLSGENAALGNAMLKSAQMALFDMGYQNFELIPRDTAKGAANAASDAVRQGASLLLGPVFAADVKAVKPIAQAANINMIAFSTDWTLAGGNTFIMGFLPFDQVNRVVGYAAAQNIKSMGLFSPAGTYGNAVTSSLQAATGRTGIDLSATQRFDGSAAALQQAAQQFAQSAQQTQAVFIPAGGAQAVSISQALAQNGVDARRMGTGLFDDQTLAASSAMEGAWFAAPAPSLRSGFEMRFNQTYGIAPPRLATLSYDATALAAVLAQRGFASDGKPAFDRDSITNPNGFSGVDGIFRFRADGMAERGLAVLELKQGRIEVIDPAPSTFQAPAF